MIFGEGGVVLLVFNGNELFAVPILDGQAVGRLHAAAVVIPEDFAAADRDGRFEGVHDPWICQNVASVVRRPAAFRAFVVVVQVRYAVIRIAVEGV